jgi:hypothetical protein
MKSTYNEMDAELTPLKLKDPKELAELKPQPQMS